MSKDEEKETKEKELQPHQGSVACEDPELSKWLNRLWHSKEIPERVEVWQIQGQNTRGEMIFHEDFHAKKLDPEQVNRLANEIIEACQNDCDTRTRALPRAYQIAIIDRNRKANPLCRGLGPIQPKRNYAMAKVADDSHENADDDLSPKQLDMQYVRMGMDQARWDKQRYDSVIGNLFTLYHSVVQEQRTWNEKLTLMIERLQGQNMAAFVQVQDLQDRRAERDIMLRREQMKIDAMEDGKRVVLNLLPGLVSSVSKQPQLAPVQEQAPATDSTPKNYGNSPERTLVDNFLHDCEKKNIDTALFGELEERDGKMVQTRPGVFTVPQLSVLVGVRQGRLPAAALDQLMPKWGHKNEITEEQIAKAQQAGVTEGMVLGLYEIVSHRYKAREAVAAAQQSEPKEEIHP